MNPYTNATFWTFFSTFFERLFLFIQGKISFEAMATDEIQVVVLAAIGAASAILGTWLTYRRMAMLANALSHTLLLGVAGAFLLYRLWSPEEISTLFAVPFSLLVTGGVIAGVVTALLTESLKTKVGLPEDASIGIVFTSFFALALVLVNVASRNAHLGIDAIVGNVDVLQRGAVIEALLLFCGVFLVEACARKELLSTTFDPLFSTTLGIPSNWVNFLLMGLTALLLTLAFQAVGVIQVLSFLVIPPLFATQFSHSIPRILYLGAIFACITAFIGVALSRHLLTVYELPVSTGSLVVTLETFFLSLALISTKFFKHRLEKHYEPKSRTF